MGRESGELVIDCWCIDEMEFEGRRSSPAGEHLVQTFLPRFLDLDEQVFSIIDCFHLLFTITHSITIPYRLSRLSYLIFINSFFDVINSLKGNLYSGCVTMNKWFMEMWRCEVDRWYVKNKNNKYGKTQLYMMCYSFECISQ